MKEIRVEYRGVAGTVKARAVARVRETKTQIVVEEWMAFERVGTNMITDPSRAHPAGEIRFWKGSGRPVGLRGDVPFGWRIA